MNQTLKKGLALLMTLVMCLCLLPVAGITADAAELVTNTPVAGTAYKFGMIQQNVSTSSVYYLAGGMSSYYMSTTTNQDAAIDVYLEETTGGYYLYTYVGEVKTYINMVVSDTHVNGAYEASAATVYTYDETSKTLIAQVNGEHYWFGTRNDKTYTTVGPCKTAYNGFYCQFYSVAPAQCQHANTNVEGALEATCTENGNTGKTVCADCGQTVSEGTVIEAPGHNFENGLCTVCGQADNGEATANFADFNTIVTTNANGDSSYTKTYTTANGWTVANSAIQAGGTTVMNPQFPVIGPDNTYKAPCLNGKVSAPGKLTSPTLNGGIAKLTMNYTKMFTDTVLSVTITVTDLATGTTYTQVVEKEADKNTKYEIWNYEWTLEAPISGDFTIEVVNNCPSNATGNKDRITILELAWEAPQCQHTNTNVEGALEATCTENGYTGNTVCADCGELVSEGTVIEAPGHNYENGLCTGCGEADPDAPAAPAGNKADFNTIVTSNANGDSSYTKTHTTANGWTVTNSAVQAGGATVMNPQFPVIGPDNTYKAVCLNGKVSAPGKLTSPTLTGGISKLTMDYTKMFTDTVLSVTITVTDLATGTTYTQVVEKEADKNTKYEIWNYEWTLEAPISGDFTIEVVNNCPSNATGNKDRITILELAWESAPAEAPACQHTNTTVEGALEATCTENGHTGNTVCADCGETISEGTVIEAPGHSFAEGVCGTCGAEDPDYVPEETPSTGDHSMLLPAGIILMLSVAAIVVTAKKRYVA